MDIEFLRNTDPELYRCLSLESQRQADGIEMIANVLESIGITVNTKAIPFDDSPVARGLRAGTTVLTQRGFDEAALDAVADIWLDIVRSPDDSAVIEDCRAQVLELTRKFPIPDVYKS